MADVMRRVPGIDWTRVPSAVRSMFEGKVSALCTSMDEAQSLPRFFGDTAFCPYLPILLVIPGLDSVVQVEGRGVTTVAELTDLCVTTWGRNEERMARNGGKLLDFDALREKHGLMPRNQLGAALAESITKRMDEHRRNRRTDPARDPYRASYPRKSFAVSEENA